MIMTQWPIFVGLLQSSWGEYDPKKLRLLPKLMDTKKYSFSKLPYSEIRSIFINELCDYICEVEVTPEDIAEFMLVFLDEVFDGMPAQDDKSHVSIASAIMRLFEDLEKGDYTFYDEIVKKYEQIKDQPMQFVDTGITYKPEGEGSDHSSDYSDDDEEAVSKKKLEDEAAKKDAEEIHRKMQEEEDAKKKKKKQKKNEMIMDEEELPQQYSYTVNHEENDADEWKKA